MQRTRHLVKSSVIVILLFGLGKLTGLVRARLVAQTFGAGTEYDAFAAANQLPEVFFTVIAGGSLAAAFIPVYSKYLTQRNEADSTRLANTVLTLVFIVLGSISALGAILAPWLTEVVLVPDFTPEAQQLTAQIMRVILIQTTIFGIGGVISSILNAHQHFILPAAAPLALDLGYVIGIWFFVPSMGILGLAWGTVVGSLVFVAIQLPGLWRFGYRIRPALAVRMAGVREIVRLMGPRVVTLGAIQFSDLFIIRLASGLAPGATSVYFYAYALMQFPQTLLGTAVGLVVFPTLAELYNDRDIDGLKSAASRTLAIVWTLTVPAAVLTLLLGRSAIEVFFQGGAFDATTTQLVYVVLAVFSLRIVSESTLEIVARLFYAQHNTRTPMFAYLGWLAVTVVGAMLLVEPYGVAGIALATTISFTLLAAVLFELNRRALRGLGGPELARTMLRAVAGSALMAGVVLVVNRFVDSPLLYLAVAGVAGVAVYVAAITLMGGRELRDLLQVVRSSPA